MEKTKELEEAAFKYCQTAPFYLGKYEGFIAGAKWQKEKSITPFEKAIKDTIEGSKSGFDAGGNEYVATTTFNDGKIVGSKVEMVERNVGRPNLSFITSKNFKDYSEYAVWFCNLSTEQMEIVRKLSMVNLPKLVVCAEMLFDNISDKPEGYAFKIVSETLNVGK